MTAAKNDTRLVIGPSDLVAIIAGNGQLPHDVVAGLNQIGHKPLVAAIIGEADGFSPSSDQYTYLPVTLEHIAVLIKDLKKRGVTMLVMAGGIERRPQLRNVKFPFWILRYLPGFMLSFARGDDALLSLLIRVIESYGIRVIGAHEFAPDSIAQFGVLGQVKPNRSDEADISAGLEAAHLIGKLDIGQGAIAVGGRVIALEGIEGTDGLLERAVALRSHGRIAGQKRGALVKCSKPGQELRADLPTIGPRTIIDAHAAGLSGVAVEAERSFILNYAETVRLADELGLYLVGFEKGREK